jgi:hypothetical protein
MYALQRAINGARSGSPAKLSYGLIGTKAKAASTLAPVPHHVSSSRVARKGGEQLS